MSPHRLFRFVVRDLLTYSGNIDPGTNSFSVLAGNDSTHTSRQYFDAYAYQNDEPGRGGGSRHCDNGISTQYGNAGLIRKEGSLCLYGITGLSIPTSLTKINNIDHYLITGDTTTPEIINPESRFQHSQFNDNFNLFKSPMGQGMGRLYRLV